MIALEVAKVRISPEYLDDKIGEFVFLPSWLRLGLV